MRRGSIYVGCSDSSSAVYCGSLANARNALQKRCISGYLSPLLASLFGKSQIGELKLEMTPLDLSGDTANPKSPRTRYAHRRVVKSCSTHTRRRCIKGDTGNRTSSGLKLLLMSALHLFGVLWRRRPI